MANLFPVLEVFIFASVCSLKLLVIDVMTHLPLDKMKFGFITKRLA